MNRWYVNSIASPQKIAASQTLAEHDMVYLNTSGLVQIALYTTGSLLGSMAQKVAAPAASTRVFVWDYPFQVFEAQCSGVASGRGLLNTTQTDPVDIEGATGVMEINEDASTENLLWLIGVGEDPDSCEESVLDGTDDNTTFLCKIALHNAHGNVTA